MLGLVVLVFGSCTRRERHPLVACSGSTPTDSVDSMLSDTLTHYEELVEELSSAEQRDETFSDFLFSFINNRRFQAERVRFPLSFTALDGADRRIKSGHSFRSLFTWPVADEYCLLLNNEKQMEDFQNNMIQDKVEVQIIDLQNTTIRGFNFQRNGKKWQCFRVREYVPEDDLLDFLRFYNRFSTDSLFQSQSLASSIAFSMPVDGNESDVIEGILEPYQWEAFQPNLPVHYITNIFFGQQLQRFEQVVLLHCGIANGLFDVFTFRRHNGKWRLVSFKD